MTDLMNSLFIYIFFPGFIFSFILSILVGYIDRKLTARLQYRQGPPLLQSLYDFFKLLSKEVVVPEGSNFLFLLSPFISFASIILASTILWTTLFFNKSFVGDIIVLIYLLTIPSLMLILGSSSSGNVIASVGVSREIKVLLSYELPLVTALLVPIIQSKSFSLLEIMKNNSITLASVLSFFVVLISFHAKLGLVPFDSAEAETEIASGILIEYSGFLLGLIKLTKQMMLSVLPAFIVLIYFYGNGNLLLFVLKYLVILVLITLIRNTNPRLKIKQILKFFWYIVFPLSLLSVILAVISL
ncbi:MAG: NADH-quinone oxidoreductase subunit H [Endomicrobia bacterium]|nr:NADH-quinone oxidoreductase subunit H [Endomicrobiia bacterium]